VVGEIELYWSIDLVRIRDIGEVGEEDNRENRSS